MEKEPSKWKAKTQKDSLEKNQKIISWSNQANGKQNHRKNSFEKNLEKIIF